MKFCKKCHTNKSFGEFHKNRNTADGLSYSCKQCKRDYDLAYREPKRKRMYQDATHRQCRMCERILEKSQIKSTYCKDCIYAYQAQRQIRRYGVSYQWYIDTLKAQGFVCAICGEGERHHKRLSIDHDHSCCDLSGNKRACGKCVRGLICSHCNKTLGMVNDSPQRLAAMIVYLANYQQL